MAGFEAQRNRFRPTALLVIVLLILTAGTASVAACGGSSSEGGDPSTSSSGSQDPASLVPEDLQNSGQVRIATNAEYPPWQFVNHRKQIVGLEVDLDKAIAEHLGLQPEYSNIAFDSIIPGLQARRYDMASSTVTDTPGRENVVDMVDFYRKVNVLIVQAGNPEGIESLDDMCGKVAAVQSGTDWAQILEDQNQTCQDAGQSEITINDFPLNTDTALAVESGRAAATLEDYVSATYRAAQSHGKLEVLTQNQYAPSLYAFAFPKDDQLALAWQAGLRAIIADGTYDEIFDKWHVKVGRLKTAELNGASQGG